MNRQVVQLMVLRKIMKENKENMERIGDITIYNADCVQIMQTLPNESIDAIITDPPYGISFLSPRTDNHKKIANDGLDEFKSALPMWLKEFHRLLTPTGVACCCCGGGGATPVSQIFTLELLKQGFYLIQTLIWDKKTIGLGWRYRPSYETILVFSKSKDKYNWYTERKDVSNILRWNNIIPQKGDHPTPKPVNLMRELILLHTKEGQTVLEPFMGGGTTAVACAMEGRKCIGIEIDEGYYNISKKRITDAVANKSLFESSEMG